MKHDLKGILRGKKTPPSPRTVTEEEEYLALRYRVLSGGSFESPIFFLQLLLAVAFDRRPA